MSKYLYAIIMLSVLLPMASCAEAGPGKALEDGMAVAHLLMEAGSFFGDAFSMLGGLAQLADGMVNVGQFHTAALYDSAIVPEHASHNYFSGITTEGGRPEKYTREAWEKINLAKKHYAEATAACAVLSMECPGLVASLTQELAEGNALASAASGAALNEAMASMQELGRLGGDLSEYGGEPFAAYSGFASEYEKPGGEYKKFRSGMQGYAFIDASGKVEIGCDVGPIDGMMLVPAIGLARVAGCIEVKPSALATQYHRSYNMLIGASDRGSGIRKVLSANKRMREAIALMHAEHGWAKERLAESQKRLDSAIAALEKTGAEEVDYGAVEQVLGMLGQTPEELLAAAREGKSLAEALSAEASRLKMLKQDNYLAESTIALRRASSEARHAGALAMAGQEEMRDLVNALEEMCESEAAQAREKGSSVLYATRVEEAVKKCSGDSTGGYVEAIKELRFMKAGGGEKSALALKEIALLEAMMKKAASDFGVEEEKMMLDRAKEYASGDWGFGARDAMLKKAYEEAIAGQASIWSKANSLYLGLAAERSEARRLLAVLEEIGAPGAGWLAGRMGAMEGKYSGVICLESLGHLSEARGLYRDIRGEAEDEALPEKLAVVEVEREAPLARCNQEAGVHYTVHAKNPYGFGLEAFSYGGIGVPALEAHGEEFFSFSKEEVPLQCGPVEEKIGWIYPARESRTAERQVVSAGVAGAIVEFTAEGVLEAETPGASIVPGGIELGIDSPGNSSVSVEYWALPSMRIEGPACEGDGKKVVCRYVLSLTCRDEQKVNVLLERPMALGDSVSASNGRAEGAGSVGVVITGASCPGYSVVDVEYADLSADAEAVLAQIVEKLGMLEDGPTKDGLVERYNSLAGKSDAEIISRGTGLLGDIEAALLEQEVEKKRRADRELLLAQKRELEKWLVERGFPVPAMPSDPMAAISLLEKEKSIALSALSLRYGEMAERVAWLRGVRLLLEKFGARAGKAIELGEEFPGAEDGYLMFALKEVALREMAEEAEREVGALAAGGSFPEVPESPDFLLELEKAVNADVELDEPELVLREEVFAEARDGLDSLRSRRGKAAEKLGGISGLEALDREKDYPQGISMEYERIRGKSEEELARAREAASEKVGAALESGDEHYASLARESLEAGYVNRAYAYAAHALSGGSPATGLVSMEGSVLFLAPLALAAGVWQLRKKQKNETKVQRAIRLAR